MRVPGIPAVSSPSLTVIHGVKKPSNFPAPKLTGLKIKPLSNGAKVIHNYSGGPQKNFVFTDPRKMATHIKRAIHNEWLSPESGTTGEAEKIEHAGNF